MEIVGFYGGVPKGNYRDSSIPCARRDEPVSRFTWSSSVRVPLVLSSWNRNQVLNVHPEWILN